MAERWLEEARHLPEFQDENWRAGYDVRIYPDTDGYYVYAAGLDLFEYVTVPEIVDLEALEQEFWMSHTGPRKFLCCLRDEPDPFMFRSGVKTEAELQELRQRRPAGKRLESYQRKQNQVRISPTYTSKSCYDIFLW